MTSAFSGDMRRVDELGRIRRLGKRLAPSLARVASAPRGAYALSLLEAYIAAIQGKGSGSGWDIDGETAVAARYIVRPDPVILDVGANRGAWSSSLIDRIAHLRPRFVLVEPALEWQTVLRELPIPKLTVVHAAVGAEEGEALLFSDEHGSEAASLYERRDSYHQSEGGPLAQQVRVRTIDGLMMALGLEVVDFLKLDVEGHELAALRGAATALNGRAIRVVAFEFGSGQLNSRTVFHDFWDILTPLGYAIHRILPGGRTTPVKRYYEDLEYFRGVSNYLAVL